MIKVAIPVVLAFAAVGANAVVAAPTVGTSKPAFEWTKIQDLKADEKEVNRPIKQKWAVVIGASKFKEKRLDGDEQGMDRSAHEFYNYLVDENGGRFAPSHVKLLTNSDATRGNIMSSLGQNWLGSLAGPDDLVVVYFATSSFPTTDGGTYLCAYDVTLDNMYSTCVSMQDLMGTLKKNVKSDRILLVLQAGYSGAAELGSKALYSGYNLDLDKFVLGKGHVIISSSGPDEITWGDVFSRHFINALRQQNGMIGLAKAFATAQKATADETAALSSKGKKQTPQMKSDWVGNDLIIGAPPAEKVSALPDGVVSFISAEAYYLKATNLAGEAKFDEAIPQYERALAIDPAYPDALADYGAVLAIKDRLSDAASAYQKAIAARPEDVLFHSNYARILDRLGRSQEAVTELERAYKINPKDRVVLMALAGKNLAAGNTDLAVHYNQEASTLFPKDSKVHERLSYALAKSGENEEALAEAKQAVKLDAKSVSAQMNLGSIQMLQGDKAAAIGAYKDALSIDPNSADAHFLLSRAYESAGDKPAATAELEQFLKLCSTSDARGLAARKHLIELGSASATK